MEAVQAPELDPITASLLNAFRNISRSRRYLVGAKSAIPLRLAVRDITDWLEVHPVPLPRSIIDSVIFELDELAIAESDS